MKTSTASTTCNAMEFITSRANPLCAHIRKLNTARSYRRTSGQFVCEGPKLLGEALRWGARIDAVVAAQGTSLPEVPAGTRCVEVPADLLKSLADTETPQGVLFLCRLPDAPPDKLTGARYLVLDGVQDPGNVGTVWRTADAFGADGLLLLPGCADPFSPKTIRATMGACFRLPVFEWELADLEAKLAEAGIPLYATALREDTGDLRGQDLSRCAVVIGSEGQGVSAEALSRCEKTLKIPMRERCESLNAAVAASVVLWEAYRSI